MFTGIIEEIGRVDHIKAGAKSIVLEIGASKILDDLKVGDSVATNGVCLTVASLNEHGYMADVMNETMLRSSLGSLRRKDHVNLERAMSVNSRFGGHIVTGHIDGTGTIVSIKREDIAIWYTFKVSENIMRYIVDKGSIAVDGISLTVASVEKGTFSVSVIPHTAEATVLIEKKHGAVVNLENDIIGKYVEKLVNQPKAITKEFLTENGY